MPKFTITEHMPATVVRTYEVEADNETAALNQVLGGKATEVHRTMENVCFEDATYRIEGEEAAE